MTNNWSFLDEPVSLILNLGLLWVKLPQDFSYPLDKHVGLKSDLLGFEFVEEIFGRHRFPHEVPSYNIIRQPGHVSDLQKMKIRLWLIKFNDLR